MTRVKVFNFQSCSHNVCSLVIFTNSYLGYSGSLGLLQRLFGSVSFFLFFFFFISGSRALAVGLFPSKGKEFLETNIGECVSVVCFIDYVQLREFPS